MNKRNINELSAQTEADNDLTAQDQQVSQPIANTNVGSSMVEKSLMLLTALLNGKELEKHHTDKDSPWYDNQVSGLRCPIAEYDGRVHFEMWGWGTAYGNAEDRVLEIIKNPEKWDVSGKSFKNEGS